MKRIKCTVAYDGTDFFGFQSQRDKRTVQGEIEKALRQIHKDEEILIHGSGRTDKGVHAKGQVFHFDTPLSLREENWQKALNSLLPDDIHIRRAEFVPESFHARFSAVAKEYHYYVRTSEEWDVFRRNYAYHYPVSLNIEKMKEACTYLEGTHDFTTFSSAKATVKGSRVRTLYSATCEEYEAGVRFSFCGNGFLYHMVRILSGFLLDVGEGKWQPEQIPELFMAKDRSIIGKTLGPEGLYLIRVDYE